MPNAASHPGAASVLVDGARLCLAPTPHPASHVCDACLGARVDALHQPVLRLRADATYLMNELRTIQFTPDELRRLRALLR